MKAREIDLPRMGKTLFSPTMAHSLLRGDLISPEGDATTYWVVAPAYEVWSDFDGIEAEVVIGYDADGRELVLSFGWNESVLCATGARAGGVA